MGTVLAIFGAIAALLGSAQGGPAQVPEKPKSLCEEYNGSDAAVLLGRVVRHETVVEEEWQAPRDYTPPPRSIRIDAVVVRVLESFRGDFSGELLIAADQYRSYSPMRQPPQAARFDPPLAAGQSYVFYAFVPWGYHDHLVARLAIPANSVEIKELRKRSHMAGGSIYGTLKDMVFLRPGSSTFAGRVTQRGYDDESPKVHIEVAQVAVVESFAGVTAKEMSVFSPLMGGGDSPPFIFSFRPPLEVGETYLFVTSEVKAWYTANDGSTQMRRELVPNLILPAAFAPSEMLRRRLRSHVDGTTDAKIIAMAESDDWRFKARAAATTPVLSYHFDDVPPGTYSLAVETEGIVFIGPWSAQVRAGGCVAVDLYNTKYFQVPVADCSSRTEHPSLCEKFDGARAVFMAEKPVTIGVLH